MPMMLGVIHGIDYTLNSWLVGAVIFYGLNLPVGGQGAKALLSDWPKRLQVLLGLTFLSSFTWMLFTLSDMAGSWVPSELWTAMIHTRFGHFWCVKLALLAVVFLISRWPVRGRCGTFGFLILVPLLPLFSVVTGHSGAQKEFVMFRLAVDWSHSLAVGVWSGGLWMLYIWLGKRLSVKQVPPEMSYRVVRRFSRFAMTSTGVIALSGLLMAYLAGVSIFSPWATTYGLLILGKVFFFAAILLVAAINHFVHLKKWTPERELEFTRGVRREVRLELVLLLLVFALAGFLARTPMPSDLG